MARYAEAIRLPNDGIRFFFNPKVDLGGSVSDEIAQLAAFVVASRSSKKSKVSEWLIENHQPAS